jgi:hypothetical protein
MSVNPTSIVSGSGFSATPVPAQASLQRTVSDSESEAFADAVQSKTGSNSLTTEDVMKAISLGVVNNIMIQQEEGRNNISATIEGREP